MNTTDMQPAFATINAHFENYAKTTTEQTTLEGFVSWAWDVREEMIAALEGGDLTQICDDVIYSIEQESQLDGEIEVPNAQECAAWLAYHKDALIAELTDSIELWL